MSFSFLVISFSVEKLLSDLSYPGVKALLENKTNAKLTCKNILEVL